MRALMLGGYSSDWVEMNMARKVSPARQASGAVLSSAISRQAA